MDPPTVRHQQTIKGNSSDAARKQKAKRHLLVVVTAFSALLAFEAIKHVLLLPGRTHSEISKPTFTYPHDDPDHPWHWTRKGSPDRALSQKRDCNNVSYKDLYEHFHQYGYAIFTSCSVEANEEFVLRRVRDYTKSLTARRQITAKVPTVRQLSTDPDTLEFIEYLHGGRRVFPFQTLNFPIGTQQPIHSDVIHFDTMPRLLMTASWTALEDMSEDNGPLKFYPKSHHMGTWDFVETGMRLKEGPNGVKESDTEYFSIFYGRELVKLLEKAGLEPKVASDMKYGQSLVWAAGLAHGGSKQNNMKLSRLSQVTHYWFEGADYYWVPRLSDPSKGFVRYKTDIPSCKASPFAPAGLHSCADSYIAKWMKEVENAEL